MKRRLYSRIGCALGMLFLILDSPQAIDSARESVQLCVRTVIPSLFPFFVLSAYLTGAGGGSIILSGLLGGYPVGAQALARTAAAGGMEGNQANRMLTWCSQAGPSFIFGIAAAQFPNMRYGWFLWGIQLLSAFSVCVTFSGNHRIAPNSPPTKANNLSTSMQTAIRSIAGVCGWVVIFRIILGFLERWVFFFLPDTLKILISGTLELTNGCLMLSLIEDVGLRFLLCLVFLNFGGLCVVFQTFSLAAGLDFRYYLAGKMAQTMFAAAYGCILLGHYLALVPLGAFWMAIHFVKGRKNSSIPLELGV